MISPRLLRGSGLVLITATIMVGARRSIHMQEPLKWRAQFSRAALQIPFDSERAPVADSGLPKNAYPEGAPKMTIALPRMRDSARVAGIESRITSAGAYRRLGLAPGVNYVWRETVRDTLRQWIIPADTKYPVRWVAFSQHTHKGAKPWPRLRVVDTVSRISSAGGTPRRSTLAIERCTPECPREPWCSGRDTTRSDNFYPALSQIQRYFERNRVVWGNGR